MRRQIIHCDGCKKNLDEKHAHNWLYVDSNGVDYEGDFCQECADKVISSLLEIAPDGLRVYGEVDDTNSG